MAISNAKLLTGGTTVFTCPGTPVTDVQEHAVTCMIFCNTDSVDRNIDLHVLNSSQTVLSNPETQIIKSLTIPTGETFTFDTEKLVLTTGDFIEAVPSASNVIMVTVSSFRVS
jgi:hypothetical protein